MSDQPQRIGEEANGRKSDPTALTTDQLQREIAHVLQLIQTEFTGRDNLNDERFKSIDDRFTDFEARRGELKEDNQREMFTALVSIKSAIDKGETNTKETITQLSANFATEVRALRRETDELKTRVTIVEAMKSGGREVTTDTRASAAAIYAAVGFAITLIGFIVFLAAKGGP